MHGLIALPLAFAGGLTGLGVASMACYFLVTPSTVSSQGIVLEDGTHMFWAKFGDGEMDGDRIKAYYPHNPELDWTANPSGRAGTALKRGVFTGQTPGRPAFQPAHPDDRERSEWFAVYQPAGVNLSTVLARVLDDFKNHQLGTPANINAAIANINGAITNAMAVQP